MKLHVGCGTVYLEGWVNVDMPRPVVFLAEERPDLVALRLTSEDRYYGRHDDKSLASLRGGPVTQDCVCDRYGSFTQLPVRLGTVTEVLSRQCFEHLDRHEAADALREITRALTPDGILRLDVPDPDETLRMYHASGDEFYIRHLFGPRRDIYGTHTQYTRPMLIDLVEEAGFRLVYEEPNIHFYPAFCLRFIRP